MDVIKAGEREYELVPDWGGLPAGWEWGHVPAVEVDAADNVHVFTRTGHPYMIFDKTGTLVDHWGEQIFEDAHGITVTSDGSVYFVDRAPHIVLKFDAAGRHQFTLGTRNRPSDTGYVTPEGNDDPFTGASMLNGVAYPGPPFNEPTGVTVSPDGTIYVSDGYRNARVHKFDADGKLLTSWGEPGHCRVLRDTTDLPGHFHTPHNILEVGGKVYVADRQNSRIQVFTLAGEHLATWTGFLRPSDLHVSLSEGVIYVSEMEERVSIIDLEGNLVGRFGRERGTGAGQFWGPHGIASDSEGSIYVANVHGEQLQKYARRS